FNRVTVFVDQIAVLLFVIIQRLVSRLHNKISILRQGVASPAGVSRHTADKADLHLRIFPERRQPGAVPIRWFQQMVGDGTLRLPTGIFRSSNWMSSCIVVSCPQIL